MSMHVLNTSRY